VNEEKRTIFIGIKIPPGLNQRIEEDVKNTEDFRNKSEWIVAAIRAYEEQRTKLIAERKKAFSDESNFITSSGNLRTGRVK